MKPTMSQSADVWLMLAPLSRRHARVRDMKLTSKLAAMACRQPETTFTWDRTNLWPYSNSSGYSCSHETGQFTGQKVSRIHPVLCAGG